MKSEPSGAFLRRYFEYNRVRTRMLRSFVLNCGLLIAVGTVVYLLRGDIPVTLYGAWTLGWVVMGSTAFWAALLEFRDSWYRMLEKCCDTRGRASKSSDPSSGTSLAEAPASTEA